MFSIQLLKLRRNSNIKYNIQNGIKKFYTGCSSFQEELKLFDNQLFDFETTDELKIFYNDSKLILNKYYDKKILFLDYYTSLVIKEKTDLDSIDLTILDDILNDMSVENLKKLDYLYILSLMESLYNLNYYPFIHTNKNKIWIVFEYLIIGTKKFKQIPIVLYGIILKSFQKFFSLKNTTISPEEIFEVMEYQLVIFLKNAKSSKFEIDIKNLNKYAEIYSLFGKNLEGSVELYNLIIENLLPIKYIKLLDTNSLIGIYFSTILIQKKNFRSKIINNFLIELENEIHEILKINNTKLTFEDRDVLNWCFLERKFKNKLV